MKERGDLKARRAFLVSVPASLGGIEVIEVASEPMEIQADMEDACLLI